MKSFKTISPIDSRVYCQRELASDVDVEDCLENARRIQQQWKSTPLEQRIQYCQRAVDWIQQHKPELAQEICWQMGRPIRYAQGEIDGLTERALHMMAIAPSALAPTLLPEKPGFERYIQREALGTVLVVAPWNYPYLTAVNSIVPALLAGNCVVLKHARQTPLVAERFAQAFAAAGLPDGVFQYLHLSHQQTEGMIGTGLVDYVAFTGSVDGGEAIEAAAAGQFIGVGLELGGKDPAYVRADADIPHAVETLVDGALFNSGQSCCSIERVYVHNDAYDAFVRKAKALMQAYKMGPSNDPEVMLGPLVNAKAAQFVREQIAEAIELGAKAHLSESDFPASQPGTPYLAPQLLTGVNHSMRIMTEETFGPVLAVQKVGSDSEAIHLMNDSPFGLTACICSQDMKKAAELGQQIQTGTLFVNRCDYLDPALAWTGTGQSGRGVSLSRFGFDVLTRPKSFHLKQV